MEATFPTSSSSQKLGRAIITVFTALVVVIIGVILLSSTSSGNAEPPLSSLTPNSGNPINPPPNFPEEGKKLIWRTVEFEGGRYILGFGKDGKVLAWIRCAGAQVTDILSKVPAGVQQTVYQSKVWVDASVGSNGLGKALWMWSDSLLTPGTQRIIIDLSKGWATAQLSRVLEQGGVFLYQNPELGIYIYELP